MRWRITPAILAVVAVIQSPSGAVAQQQHPNILVIMADDIGYWNIAPTTAA